MDELKFICEHCNKEFKTKNTLRCHLERSKKCMKQRGEVLESKFICGFCDHTSMTKNDLEKHIETCNNVEHTIIKENELKILLKEKDKNISEKDRQIQQLLEQLREKDNTIKELAEKAISKPTITNNTTINNLHIISEEHIKDQAKFLTLEHIKKGALGYSEYFLEYPLKERIACTDYSRRKIKYKNESGVVVTDPEMTTLSDLLFKSIKERNRELTIQYTTELTDKFKTAKDPTQLAYFMEVAGKFSDQDIAVFKMFNGDKNDFFHDMIRNICSKTVVNS